MLLKRYKGNPVLEPILEHPWESVVVFNCAAILLKNKIHILYRARGVRGGISRIGYASSSDGYHIDERLPEPVFGPTPFDDREAFGCEDPRLTRLGDTLYMTYTAYGCVPGMSREIKWPQIAITTISVKDFLAKRWNWCERIYPFPFTDNKDAVIFPEKIKGRYVMYHRIPQHIWVGYSDDLHRWYDNSIVMQPGGYGWEYYKLGAGAPPIKTDKGWLFIYHAVDNRMFYRLGLAFIDLDNPEKIIYRHPEPILEPGEVYEKTGDTSNVVFTCGAVVKDDVLFVYYGAADTVIGVATCPMKKILSLF